MLHVCHVFPSHLVFACTVFSITEAEAPCFKLFLCPEHMLPCVLFPFEDSGSQVGGPGAPTPPGRCLSQTQPSREPGSAPLSLAIAPPHTQVPERVNSLTDRPEASFTRCCRASLWRAWMLLPAAASHRAAPPGPHRLRAIPCSPLPPSGCAASGTLDPTSRASPAQGSEGIGGSPEPEAAPFSGDSLVLSRRVPRGLPGQSVRPQTPSRCLGPLPSGLELGAWSLGQPQSCSFPTAELV